MARPSAPAGFVAEEGRDAISWMREALAREARELGLFAAKGIQRALELGAPLPGGRGSAVSLVLPASGAEVVVRRLRHGGLLAPLLGASYWGASRVLREFVATQQLFGTGAPVPEPAFALARRRAGPLWELAIGTARLPGAALAVAARGTGRVEALQAAARAVRSLHDCGGRHADLNAENLLIAQQRSGSHASVIDLDRMQVSAPVPPRRRAREIARLWRSLAKRGSALSDAERSAFVATYTAGDAALASALEHALRRERARSALHAWRYARR